MKMKIAIADDHPMVIKGLRNMLEEYDDVEVCATYSDGQQLLNGLKTITPDILLLDLKMPGMAGDEALKHINKDYPDLRVIVLTNHDSAIYINNMINMGVWGYLVKTVEDSVLYEALRAVYHGEKYMEPNMQKKVEDLNEGIKRTVALKYKLTEREKQVLQQIVNGLSSPEIAAQLFLSVHTVDKYRDSVMLKLEAKNTAALVATALKAGLAD